MSVERDEPQQLWGILVVGAIGGLLGGVIISSALWGNLMDWALTRSKLYEARYEYYFRGANERGYLDLCPDAGEPGVRFKDECAPPLPTKENQSE